MAIVDLELEAAEAAAAEMRALGLAADVTGADAMAAAVAAVVERFGGLDVVVANAGIATRVTTARVMDPEVFERVIDVDLLGVWRTVRRFCRRSSPGTVTLSWSRRSTRSPTA